MPCLPISYSNLAKASTTYDSSKPLYMLNLWKFRETAFYPPEYSAVAGEPCTGKEAMDRYRETIMAVVPPGAMVWFNSTTVTHVVAPEGEHWDAAVIVKYDSLEGFIKMVECKDYKDNIEPHRLAGLEDFRLIMLDKTEQ